MSLFVNTGKAWWIPSCFHLIYSSSPLHTKHIIELGITKEFKIVGLNETGLTENIAHLGNTTWDCLKDQSGICIMKTKNLNARKRL